MKKRNLFDELMEGVDALKAEREVKATLHRVSLPPDAEPKNNETNPDSSKTKTRFYD